MRQPSPSQLRCTLHHQRNLSNLLRTRQVGFECRLALKWFKLFFLNHRLQDNTDSIESRIAHQPIAQSQPRYRSIFSHGDSPLMRRASARREPPSHPHHAPPQPIGFPVAEFGKISTRGHSNISTVSPFPATASRTTHKKPVARSASCWAGPDSPSSEAQLNDVPTHSSASAFANNLHLLEI